MADIDPTQARFNEIVHREHVMEMLTVETPPWDIATTEGIPDLPLQRQRISQEAARVVCGSLLKDAALSDVLFTPTFLAVVSTAQCQMKLLPKGPRSVTTLINDAAFLVGHFPNPGDALQFREQIEYNAEKRGDPIMHQEFIAATDLMSTALSEPLADQLTSYAHASLSLARRQNAFELMLDTLYGDRYSFWKSIPDLA